MLFLAGVDDGDAVGEEEEGDDIFGLGVVICVAGRDKYIFLYKVEETYCANRGLSWFSMKFPSKVGSEQLEATELIML